MIPRDRLMLGMVELATHEDATFLVVVREFAVEMAAGAVLGVAGAMVLLQLFRRVRLASEGLYPVFALALAGSLYGVTALAHGSGFLAVFIAGLVLGDLRHPLKEEIETFPHTAMAALAELVVFIALGLTVSLGSVAAEDWADGTLLALALALIIRPLVVAITLAFTRLSLNELAFIAWSGLKGPSRSCLRYRRSWRGRRLRARLLNGLRRGSLSVLGQGTLLPVVARMLRIPVTANPPAPAERAST